MSNYLNSCKELHPLSHVSGQIIKDYPTMSSILGTLRQWNQRHQQRRTLSGLSGRMLQDIGLTREQAEFEAKKIFWVE